jgi:polyadenylate-binding protein
VKDLDESIKHADLYKIFSKYGEVLSAKVSMDESTGKSKCYGFVWFAKETSCQVALEDSKNGNMPFTCSMY